MARTPETAFTFRPLTPELLPDFVRLMGPRGACAGCWCTFFRHRRAEWEAGQGEGNRLRQEAYVRAGAVPGLVAYEGPEPVGWVAVEPRERYPVVLASRTTRPAEGEAAARGTWAITCFYVPRARRGRGLMRALVDAAVAHARGAGAVRVEAYPVDYRKPVGATFLYHGVASVFRAAGFAEVERRSATRPIVRLELADAPGRRPPRPVSAPRARPAPGRARGRSRPRRTPTRRSASRRGR
jgi:GNAT superfamily N-acetyltransferase